MIRYPRDDGNLSAVPCSMTSTRPFLYSIANGVRLRRSNRQEIEKIQLKLLHEHLQHARSSVYYSTLFRATGLERESFLTLEDIQKLPLTPRKDIERSNNDFVPPDTAVSDISHTSGTTGTPVVVPYTAHDLRRLAYNEAMAFYSAGVRQKDTILLTITLDRCFIAGLAYYSGAVFLGAAAIRSGPGQPAQQWQLIKTLKPSVLLGVPTFLLSLARYGEAHGFDCKASGIKKIVTIGEPVRTARMDLTPLGQLLQKSWGAEIYSSYGATEVETAFADCSFANGSHVHPELMIVEILDDQGNVQPDGVPGEIVVTPLGVEGFPLLRFQTGDIARKHTSLCPCGWNTMRLGPIEGRISQRLKYKGTTLYPDMILQTLQEIPGSDNSYIEVRHTFDLADEITVVIGGNESTFDIDHARNLLQAHLRVIPEIVMHDLKDVIEKTGKGRLRKPIRFFDLRPSHTREGGTRGCSESF